MKLDFSLSWLNKLFKKFLKRTLLEKILIIMIIIVPFIIFNSKKEGFKQKEKFLLKEDGNIYDKFYSSIYDSLAFDESRYDFECQKLKKIIQNKNSKVLDIGCGTGNHIDFFNKNGIKSVGLDKSSSMIAEAKSKFPKGNFKVGNCLKGLTFNSNSFSHITALYFTIYEIKNKSLFFKNCYSWLKPGGVLMVHLVDRDKFDPILNTADPLTLTSPQKHAEKRITNSVIKFKEFLYKADFKYNDTDISHFIEKFKDDATGHVRKHDRTIYMEKRNQIIKMAKNVGFISHTSIHMVPCQYENQYLHVFYKPN